MDDFASPLEKGSSFADFLESLPTILAAGDVKAVAHAVVEAHLAEKTVAIGIGAHVIKVGLGPLIIDLMERGVVNAVAMNGAGIVHDFEVAYAGQTSEDVEAELGSGSFGMARRRGGS